MVPMVRVSPSAYRALSLSAASLQLRLGRRVSLSDAIDYLASCQRGSARRFWKFLKERRSSGRGRARGGAAEGTPLVHIPMKSVHAAMNRRFPKK